MAKRVELGFVVMTPGVRDTVPADEVIAALRRYRRGEWGKVDADDAQANEYALKHGERLLGAYEAGGVDFWIITEWDRSVTTVLLPEEY